MKKERKNRGYWSKEKCHEVALKYNNRNDFKNENKSAYNICLRNNWSDEVCSHLKGYKPKGYWTKEKCHKEALKYKNRITFHKYSSWVYRISLKNDWMDDICSHMKVIGNLIKRCIYVYEFSDNF